MIRDELATPLSAAQRRKTGHKIEAEVVNWLSQQGIVILAQNYQCKRGEIDVIGLEQDILVFFEVRYRHANHLVSAEESISRQKQQRILRTAEHFLQYAWKKDLPRCRLDVIAVNAQRNELNYNWIRNAFN
ncbi:MAG TPA: YraN family protein [Pseudomonadales bacterium]|nr:YraN family protein [Pseudomonadales bacterium]